MYVYVFYGRPLTESLNFIQYNQDKTKVNSFSTSRGEGESQPGESDGSASPLLPR